MKYLRTLVLVVAMLGLQQVQQPTLPPWVDPETFGILPSSGDPAVDCGQYAARDDLPQAALEVVERCLDLHGWTYDEPAEED
jgi:hypothetical protein